MRRDLLNKYISKPRYDRFLLATANNRKRAERLYSANIRLAQSFHPIIGQFEVILRNSLNDVLTRYFHDRDWIITQKVGFMNSPSLGQSRYYLKRCVQNSENKLNKFGIPLSSGKIISDQTLGFWTSFYVSAHYGLVGGQPIHVFVNKPATENRGSIHAKLDEIQKFRNRVNHCEPICFTNSNIDCTYALRIRDNLFDLITWIEPELVPLFRKLDNTQGKISQVLRI